MPKATRVKTCFVRMKSQDLKFDNGIMDINEFITVYGSFSSYCKMAKRHIGPKQYMKKEFK